MELNKQIKIIYFDVDFTAFDHNHFMIRPLTIYALKQLKTKGYKLCICTSRSYDEMIAVDKEFVDMMDCVITLAGGLYIISKKIYCQTINKNELKQIINCLETNNIIYRYATNKANCYLNKTNDYINDFFYQYYHMVPEVKPYQDEEVVQIMYYPINQEFIHEKLENIKGDILVKPMRLSNEIANINIDKGKTIEKVNKIFGFSKEQAMSFGDSENDIPMFNNTYFSVCMASGEQISKDAANYICEGQDEDGIYKTFVKYNFIEPYKEDKGLFKQISQQAHLYIKQKEAIDKISNIFVDCIKNDGVIQILGIGKFEQFAQEFYYRSGGLVYFHKIEYNNQTIDELNNENILDKRDTYLLISEYANDEIFKKLINQIKSNNQKCIVLYRQEKSDSIINKADYSFELLKNDFEIAHTIEDCFAQIINYRTYQLLKENNIKPLVFMSNNNPDSKQHNQQVLEKYGARVHR